MEFGRQVVITGRKSTSSFSNVRRKKGTASVRMNKMPFTHISFPILSLHYKRSASGFTMYNSTFLCYLYKIDA
jgi:hypothetical protein